jgi:hypothetical protein
MAPDPDDESPRRQLVMGLAALLAVALVIGGVISVVALGAVKVSGLDDSKPRATEKPSLVIPSGTPTTGLEGGASPTGVPSDTGSPGAGASGSATPSAARKAKAISLQANPLQAGPGQRVTLTGVYARHEGATLQVQRFEAGSGWADFPVTTSVVGGQFTTYVTTSRVGVNRLRVVDSAGKQVSNAVRVTIG